MKPLAARHSAMIALSLFASPAVSIAQSSGQSAWYDRLAGSRVLTEFSTNPEGFDDNGDPAARLVLGFMPRVRVHRWFEFRGAISGSRTFARDDTLTESGVQLRDPWIELWFHGVPRLAGVHVAPWAGARFPTSPSSRAADTLITPAFGVQLDREHSVSASLVLRWVVGAHFSWRAEGAAATTYRRLDSQLAGTAAVTARWSRVELGLQGRLVRWSESTPGPTGNDTQADVLSATITAWVDLVVTPWLTVGVRYSRGRLPLEVDGVYLGAYREIDPPTRLSLSVSFGLAEMFGSWDERAPARGGVMRADAAAVLGGAS